MRFALSFIGVVAANLLLGMGNLHAADKTQRPNVVIFLVDDMGVMDTSVPFLVDADGKPVKHPLNEYYRTPQMERLASQGIRFSQFSAMSVCSPTRVSIQTGQNAARHRTTNWINGGGNNATPFGPPDWNWAGLKSGDVTLPALLQAHGYHTVHVGKAHFGPGKEGHPEHIGFDVNIAGGPMGHPASYYAADEYGNKLKNKKGEPHQNAVPNLEAYYESGEFLTEALTKEANRQVSAAAKTGKPFFLNFAHYAVHSPFQADPRFVGNYPANEKFKNLPNYASLIEGMDQSLGQLLDHLEALGIAEETLVIFLGDNGSDAPLGDEQGISSSAPLRGKKGTHYEGGTRAPFIVSWARRNDQNALQQQWKISAGVVQTQPANVTDIFPTVLNLADVETPAGYAVDGSSLKTLLAGKPDSQHAQTFLMHYPHRHRSEYFTSFRDGDWKVIYHYFPNEKSEGSHYQLFNLKTDPYEQENLAGKKPVELKRLMVGLVQQLKDYDALYPVEKQGSKERVLPKIPE